MSKVPYGNGKIFTAQDETTFVSAMILENGKVIWTGDTKDLEGEYIDLNGKTVVPGFIDSHIHPMYVGAIQEQVSCMAPDVNNIEEMIEALKKSINHEYENSWVEGWGFDESQLEEGRTPTKEDLDKVSTTHSVQVTRSDFHSRVVNSKALELAGITNDTKDIPGGIIERDKNGEPTGFLLEGAAKLIDKIKPPATLEQNAQSLAKLTNRFAKLGITGVTEIMAMPNDYDIYIKAAKRGFKQRLGMYYHWKQFKDSNSGELVGIKNEENQIRINGIKLFMDGSISGHTAFMKEPYPNSDDRGFTVGSQDELLEAYEYAKTRGLQWAIHAMGDAAIQLIIDTFKDKEPWVEGGPSVRIEHCTVLSRDMIEEINKYGIGLTQQIIFFYAEYDSYRKNLDEQRFNQTYGLKSVYDNVEYFALSSDSPATLWPVAEDVFISLKAAVTRKAYNGQNINEDEKITVPQAVLLYTKKAAVVIKLPNTGQLIPGYNGDFVVLDKDIFTIDEENLDNVQVLQTYICGELVYQKVQ